MNLNHDFDDSSKEWMANKRKDSKGNYVYICGKPILSKTKQPKTCSRTCYDKLGLCAGCKIHFNWDNK
jgi:UV DNA damage repair endonuclease